jgi:hypothetical protein
MLPHFIISPNSLPVAAFRFLGCMPRMNICRPNRSRFAHESTNCPHKVRVGRALFCAAKVRIVNRIKISMMIFFLASMHEPHDIHSGASIDGVKSGEASTH